VQDATNWPYGTEPFTIVVDPETASEEKLLVTRTNIGDPQIDIVERAFDGTSAVEHAGGATTFPVFTALDADEANELTSVWESKGDIVSYGTATFARVPVGSDDTVLIADSGASSGLSWGQVDTGQLATDAVTADKIALDAVGSSEIASGAVTENELDSSVVQQLVPVGTVAATIRSSADAGWALMGTTVTNAENNYPALWAVAPAGWRSGSDLVLPDMSDRYLSGKSSTDTLGAEVGSNDVTLATANLPSHTHSGPSHSHTINHGHADNFQLSQTSHTHTVNPDNDTTGNPSVDVVHRKGDGYITSTGPGTSFRIPDMHYDAMTNGMQVHTSTFDHTHDLNLPSKTSSGANANVSLSGGVTDHSGSSGSAGTGATGATGDGDSFSIQSAHLVVNFQLKIL
jgi:microcystin-dependent protein